MERAWIYTIDLRKVHECHATMDPSEKEQRYLTYQLTFLLSYGWKMSGGFSEKTSEQSAFVPTCWLSPRYRLRPKGYQSRSKDFPEKH